jgi:hypothetical protein
MDMRINFKRGSYFKDTRRSILKDLITELCEDYDLDTTGTAEWVKSKNGLDIFITYLTEKGYKVKSYSWPSDKDPRSVGLEFDDNDPLVIALKLRYSE